jgi:hypothetical protein
MMLTHTGNNQSGVHVVGKAKFGESNFGDRSKFGDRAFTVAGPTTRNSIPLELQNCQKINKFSNKT